MKRFHHFYLRNEEQRKSKSIQLNHWINNQMGIMILVAVMIKDNLLILRLNFSIKWVQELLKFDNLK